MKKLAPQIFALGLVSFFMNSSTIIVISLSPLYLTQIVGLTPSQLGLLDGLVEFFSWTSRLFAGFLCDKVLKRKKILLPAYALIALSRPLLAMSSKFWVLASARTMDRVGNGLGATAREALVADTTDPEARGSAYGLRQSMAVLGSLAGAIFLSMSLTSSPSDSLTSNYPTYFWISSLLALISFCCLVFFVHDYKSNNKKDKVTAKNITWSQVFQNVKELGLYHWIVIALSFISTLALFSSSFISIMAFKVTGNDSLMPKLMIAQNISCTFGSYYLGRLFHRLQHKSILFIGTLCLIIANIIFIFSQTEMHFLTGMIFWGIQISVAQVLWPTLLSQNTHLKNRGTVFGLFYVTSGVAFLLANALFGKMYEMGSSPQALIVSSIVATIALFMTVISPLNKKHAI